MAYQYQSFGSGAVFTGAQAQQIEDNIRDHRHGVDGVGASGAAWTSSSKGAAFSIVSTDAGTLFKCWGDFAVTCPAAATLGSAFGVAFVNCGSQRVVINAASGQFVANNSCYALTPGEGVVLTSDGIELDIVGGRDRACVSRIFTTGSLAVVDCKIFGGDFSLYRAILMPNGNGAGLYQMQVSIDSGASFIASNYGNSTGAQTTCVNLSYFNTTSRDMIYASAEFCNNPEAMKSAQLHFTTFAYRAGALDSGFARIAAPVGLVNALRFLRNGGSFDPGTRIEVWAEGRVRR
jgi:hypothetical protein